jgi:hypothetical protein
MSSQNQFTAITTRPVFSGLPMTLRSIQFSLVFGLSAAFFGCGGSEPAPKPAAPDAASTTETAKTPASKTKAVAGKKGANKVADNADEDPRERRNKASN